MKRKVNDKMYRENNKGVKGGREDGGEEGKRQKRMTQEGEGKEGKKGENPKLLHQIEPVIRLANQETIFHNGKWLSYSKPCNKLFILSMFSLVNLFKVLLFLQDIPKQENGYDCGVFLCMVNMLKEISKLGTTTAACHIVFQHGIIISLFFSKI